MPLRQGLHVLGGDVHRVHPFQGTNADTQRRRAEVVQRTGRVLPGQPFLDQALQIAMRRGAASAGAAGNLAQAQLTLGIGQHIQKPRSNRHRLDGARSLLAGALRLRIGRGLQSVQRGYLLISDYLARRHRRARQARLPIIPSAALGRCECTRRVTPPYHFEE
ncbi:hypothetical protein D3C80_1576330 [compost metagenome]